MSFTAVTVVAFVALVINPILVGIPVVVVIVGVVVLVAIVVLCSSEKLHQSCNKIMNNATVEQGLMRAVSYELARRSDALILGKAPPLRF